MANLGNTIVNGILRVNSKVNVGESVTAPSFIGNLKGKADNGIHYMEDSGGANAVTTSPYTCAKWVGTDSTITSLYSGLTVAFKIAFAGHGTYGTSLNINGLGEHPVIANTNTMVSTRYPVGSIVILTYDATGTGSIYKNATSATAVTGVWKIADYNSDTNTLAYQVRHNNGTYLAGTVLYRYQLLVSKNETTLLPLNAVNNSTATNKTLTTEAFNPFGEILYYNSTTTVNANANIGATALYKQANLDLRYSTNVGTTLTNNKDVFLVCVPQSNGLVKLHTTPISQTLPTTDDGKVYIYLGHASSTSAIELALNHPVYQFKNSKLSYYTGSLGATKTSELTNDSGFITQTTGDGRYLKLAGGTMTGVVNTAMSGSHLEGNKGTKAIINSTASASSYATLFRKKSTNGVFTLNGWSDNVLLAYTDDARITAGTNAVATGVKFFENGSLVPYLNNQQALGASSYKWSNVYATTFTGALSGNASTATKLATARTISTTGDVIASGTFDGSGNLALATRRRGASVGQSTNTTTNPWYKVASCVMGGAYEDRWITFLVNGAYSDFSTRVGILKLRFGSSGTKLWESGALQWESVSSNITLANFVLAYKNGTDNVTVELWCKCEGSYNGYHFDVLGEGSRGGRSSRDWTLYNTWTAGSQAALPTGYTTINSTLLTFSNPTNGNAASATKLATARTIGVSGVTGTAQSFDGTKNIVIPITAVPASLLTGKSAIKGSEITNDKHWIPSSDDSVKNFVAMTKDNYTANSSSLATGTIVAITDGNEGCVTTQATSLTCELPLDL